MLSQTALGLALALAFAMPLATKWRLPIGAVAIEITIGSVAAGLVVDLLGGSVSLTLLERGLIVAGLTIGQGAALLAYRFYRDPERVVPDRDGAVVSPADGRVVYVREAAAGVLPVATKQGHDYRLQELTRTPLDFDDAVVVGISMSFADVHVNRAPIAGTVTFRRHFPGRFGSLGQPGMVFENERATTVLEGLGVQVAVVQIASRLVRQIASFVKPGQHVKLGERIGVIRLGSQVDVVLPLRPEVRVVARVGDRVRAGESLIAIHRPKPPPSGHKSRPGRVVAAAPSPEP